MSAGRGTRPRLARRATAEALGTAMLLAAVVGSGIMAERLAGGDGAVALLANTLATAAALLALILTFGPVSGAHLNPAVTLADASQGGLPWREVPAYISAQASGAFCGVAAAHIMFGEPLFFASRHARAGAAQMFSEFVATFGLLAVIWGCARVPARASAVPFAVAAYIFAAAWFTSSTSFANPAVTLARSLSDTFVGIRPADVPGFIAAQLAGAAAATLLFRWLVPGLPGLARDVVLPRGGGGEIFETAGEAAAAGPARGRAREAAEMSEKQSVLILCTGNSARSQMAEGLLRHEAGDLFEVRSAGTRPGALRPEAVRVMGEVGIDISAHRAKSVDEFAGRVFDYVITVCDNAREECPVFPAATRRLHWGFDDPAAAPGEEPERLAVFRRVRDEIRERLREFAGG